MQGEPGPNMIAAMGFVNSAGTLTYGYNATSATWDGSYYHITLTGISATAHYVTLVTPFWNTIASPVYTLSTGGDLHVVMWDSGYAQCGFSFMVVECP